MAPGSGIYSTVRNGKYMNMSGTSMACPHVAGIAGLLLSVEPNLTPLESKISYGKQCKRIKFIKKHLPGRSS